MSGTHPTADRPPMVMRRHAGAASTDPDLLVGLAADDSYLVRRQTAENPATPRWVIELLIRAGADTALRGRGTADPELPATELRRLVECGPFARELVAEHPNTDGEVLDALAADGSAQIRASVAAHPATSAATLARLCADGDQRVRRATLRNARRPDDVVELLVRAGADGELRSVAAGLPEPVEPQVCEMLAGCGPYGRFIAARNPGCPVEILLVAATDDDPVVRSAALEHPDVPAHVVARIVGEPVDLSPLRQGPAAELHALAGHPSTAVRLAVARSTVADREVVRRLLADVDARVRTEAVRSPVADPADVVLLRRAGARDDLSALAPPGEVSETELRALAGGGPWARLLAVRHPDAPGDLLAALLADDDPKLREWAAAHPQVPADIVELLRRAGAADDFQGIAEGDPAMTPNDLRRAAALGPYGAFVAAWHPAAPAELQAARG